MEGVSRENGAVKRFKRTFQEQVFDVQQFESFKEAQCVKEDKMTKKLAVLLITMLLSPQVFAGTRITGKVTGVDGKPPLLGHVHLINFQGDYRQPLQTVAVDTHGRFALQLADSGLYRLFITAVNHEHVSIPLIPDVETPEIKVGVQLAPLNYKEQFDRVQIIGDWNGFKWDGADSMQKQGDDTFTCERQAQADTISYQLLGITRDARSVNGTQADYYRYDGGGDYISVLRVRPGTVKIVFEPKKLLRTTDKNLPRVAFGKQNIRLQKLWDIDRGVQKQQDAYWSARTLYRETHEDMEGFQFDWSETVTMLKTRMHDESDRVVQQFAAVQLSKLTSYGARIDPTSVAQILELLPPTSPMWQMAPWAPRELAFRWGREKEKELMKAFAEKNPDRVVRAMALAQLALMIRDEGDKEAAAHYYEKLKSEYGDLREIQFYLKELDPNKRIRAGKPVPDFEVKLMDSDETVSNKSLLGKYYLIDFWGPWCVPCVREMKYLHEAYEKFKDKNFTILSLAFARKEDVDKFRQTKWKMPWLNALVEGGFDGELAKTFEVVGVPKPILVGPDGMILETERELRVENLETTLAKHLTK